MKWTLAGSQPGIGRIAIDGRVYTLDGVENAPIAWTSPEPGVLRGAGVLPDASVEFTLNLLLRRDLN